MGVTPLRLPLPTGMPAIAMVQEKAGGDTPEVRLVKMAWKADFHVIINPANLSTVCSTGMTVDPRPGARQVPDAVTACPAIFQGTPNAFLEGREDKAVDLLTIDVGALNTWILADSLHRHIDIMYITFGPGDGTANTDYPAIRLKNAATLSEPFTVSTDYPMYIQGNYNSTVGQWKPAALMGDAISFLSNEWTDASHAAFAYTANTTEMWVYAAIAAGHSATPCDWGGSSTGRMMHYRGSLVSLFESVKAANHVWSWRTYYNPPQRDWQFDTRFQDPTNLPPGTPNAGSVAQIAFRPVY
jgi:hypothetical protein